MLLDRTDPRSRRAVHFVFASEKVRPEYVEPVPDLDKEPIVLQGAWLMPVEELLRMKLTSFRLKDQVHIKDMDEVRTLSARLDYGNVAVNNVDAGIMNAPYGGRKQSGVGYEHGREGMLEYLNFKHIRIRYDEPKGA